MPRAFPTVKKLANVASAALWISIVLLQATRKHHEGSVGVCWDALEHRVGEIALGELAIKHSALPRNGFAVIWDVDLQKQEAQLGVTVGKEGSLGFFIRERPSTFGTIFVQLV